MRRLGEWRRIEASEVWKNRASGRSADSRDAVFELGSELWQPSKQLELVEKAASSHKGSEQVVGGTSRSKSA